MTFEKRASVILEAGSRLVKGIVGNPRIYKMAPSFNRRTLTTM